MNTVLTATKKTNPRLFPEEASSSRGEALQDDSVFGFQRWVDLQGGYCPVRVPSYYLRPSDASVLPVSNRDRFSTTASEIIWDYVLLDISALNQGEASPRSAHWAFAASSPSEVSAPTSWARMLEMPAVVPAVDRLEIGRQLEAMKDLKDDWADGLQPVRQWGEGHGKTPDAGGLDWLSRVFATHYGSALTRPYLYPTPEGGVQAEWSLGPHEASLEIDLVGHSAEWHCLNLDTGHSTERIVDLDSKAGWKWLADKLRQLES